MALVTRRRFPALELPRALLYGRFPLSSVGGGSFVDLFQGAAYGRGPGWDNGELSGTGWRLDNRWVVPWPQGSLGTLPGLLDSSQGRRSQKSSLIMSRCCTTIRAFALRFLSFSACVLDCCTGSARLSTSAVVLCEPGSTSSYWSFV